MATKKQPALWAPVPTLWHELLPPPPAGAKLEAIHSKQLALVSDAVPEAVYCKLADADVSGESCLNRQQQACFGCAAPSHLCHACKAARLAFPEIELCLACLELALAAEWERGTLDLEASRPVWCQRVKRQITVRECRLAQDRDCQPCHGCGQPSRVCEGCHIRPVRYPDDGLCLSCMVGKYGLAVHQALLRTTGRKGRLAELLAARQAKAIPPAPADPHDHGPAGKPVSPPRGLAAPVISDDLVWQAAVLIVEHCRKNKLSSVGRPWLGRRLKLPRRTVEALWQRLRQLPLLSATNPPRLRLTTLEELEAVVRPKLQLGTAGATNAPPRASVMPQIADELLRQAAAVIRDTGKCGQIWLSEKLGVPQYKIPAMQRQLEQLGILGPDRGRLGRRILKTAEEISAMLAAGVAPLPAPPAEATGAAHQAVIPDVLADLERQLGELSVGQLSPNQLTRQLEHVASVLEQRGSYKLAELIYRAAAGAAALAQVIGQLKGWQPPSAP